MGFDLIPEEEVKRQGSINLAPMVDFLFIVLAIFATVAVTRAHLFDAEVKLVQLDAPLGAGHALGDPSEHMVHLSVNKLGKYRWIRETNEFVLENSIALGRELQKQLEEGQLPKEKERTRVLLHIDRQAPWESVAQLIIAVRREGYAVHPVYEPL